MVTEPSECLTAQPLLLLGGSFKAQSDRAHRAGIPTVKREEPAPLCISSVERT